MNSVTKQLAQIVHPRDEHRKVISVLEGYLDESGIHYGAPACTVAGYYGGRGQWKKFESLWQSALTDFEVPYFHAKEFWGRAPSGERLRPYAGWNDTKDEQFLSALTNAIRKHKIYPVSSAIYPEDFFGFSQNERKYLTGAQLRNGRFITSGCPSQPYFVPFQRCVLTVASYVPDGSIAHYFLGLGRNLSGYAEEYFCQIRQHPNTPYREKLGTISFASAEETAHLQAADLFAYLAYQHAIEIRENPQAEPNHWFSLCMGRTRHLEDFPIFDRPALQSLLDLSPQTVGG